jgi:hypothetical protein
MAQRRAVGAYEYAEVAVELAQVYAENDDEGQLAGAVQ